MRGLETDRKEEMMCFNRLAKAGNIFFLLWLSVKNPIINEQTGEETICKTRTPQLYVSGIDLPEFFPSILFSSSMIKEQPKKREVAQDNMIGVMHPPVLSLKAETSAYMF